MADKRKSQEPMDAPGMYKREVKTEGPASAIIQILIFVAVVGAGLFFYNQFVTERKRIADLVTQAKEAAQGDDAVNLLAARKAYQEVGEDNLKKDDRATAMMAELTAMLFAEYGMKELEEEAGMWTDLAISKDVNKAERFAAEGYLALGKRQASRAENIVNDLERQGIRHAKLLHVLSRALLDQGKAREAQRAAEEAMKLDTTLVRLPIAHGDALLAQGNYASAKNAYDKGKQLNPAHMRARTAIILAQAVAREGSPKMQHKELENLLEEAKAINDGNPPPRTVGFIHYVDGEVAMADGKTKTALSSAEEALKVDPSLTDALALKARALAARKQTKEALAAIQEALTQVPSSLPYAQAGFEMLHRNEKTKEGVALLDGVMKANPNNPAIYPVLAVAQAKAGMAKEATATAAQAIEKLGNAHPDAIFAVARALQASGEYEKAREKYNEAIQEKGTQTWPEVFFEMGHVRMAEKQYDAAAALFTSAVAQWEKAQASIWDIADGYDAWADALTQMGGKPNLREAEKHRDKAKKLRSGR